MWSFYCLVSITTSFVFKESKGKHNVGKFIEMACKVLSDKYTGYAILTISLSMVFRHLKHKLNTLICKKDNNKPAVTEVVTKYWFWYLKITWCVCHGELIV